MLLIDEVQVGGHCIAVALGIDKTGDKHPLGLWEGATENTTVCQGGVPTVTAQNRTLSVVSRTP